MSKTVFDHLSEQIDQVVRGRRFIIAEIGKLKVSVEDLKEALSSQSGADLGKTIAELKDFIAKAVATLGELKNNVAQLNAGIRSLTQTVQNTYNIVKTSAVKPSAPAATTSAPAPGLSQPTPSVSAPTPTSAPTVTTPITTKTPSAPSSVSAPSTPSTSPVLPPKPSMTTAPSPSPAVSGAAEAKPKDQFDRILGAIDTMTAVELGNMIDELRAELSQKNPLNPILFELSMEAGRLKSFGAKKLDASAQQTLKDKIAKWRAKSA